MDYSERNLIQVKQRRLKLESIHLNDHDHQNERKVHRRNSSDFFCYSSNEEEELNSEEVVAGSEIFQKVLRGELFYLEESESEDPIDDNQSSNQVNKLPMEQSINLTQHQQIDQETSCSTILEKKESQTTQNAGTGVVSPQNEGTKIQTPEDLIREINLVTCPSNHFIRKNQGKHNRKNNISTLLELPKQQLLLQSQNSLQGIGIATSQFINPKVARIKRNNAGSQFNLQGSIQHHQENQLAQNDRSDIADEKTKCSKENMAISKFQMNSSDIDVSKAIKQVTSNITTSTELPQQQRMKFSRRGAHGFTELPRDFESLKRQREIEQSQNNCVIPNQFPATKPFMLESFRKKQEDKISGDPKQIILFDIGASSIKIEKERALEQQNATTAIEIKESAQDTSQDSKQTIVGITDHQIPEMVGESQASLEMNMKLDQLSNIIFKKQEIKTQGFINENQEGSQKKRSRGSGGSGYSEGNIHQEPDKDADEVAEDGGVGESKNEVTVNQQRKSQSFEEQMDTVMGSLGNSQKKLNDINFAKAKAAVNSVRQLRSNTVYYDQEKKMLFYQQLEQMSAKHNHVIIEGQEQQHQDGCVACELEEFIKNVNAQKDKVIETDQNVQNDPAKIFKEVPMHVIESKFYVKQVSLLNSNAQVDNNTDNRDEVIVLGNKYHPDMRRFRVYLLNQKEVYLDVEINPNVITIGTFIKFILKSYRQTPSLNQQLIRYIDQPLRYKIFPNQGDNEEECFLADTNIPDLSDNMLMIDAVGESNICCLVESEDDSDLILQTSMTSNLSVDNDPDMDLREFSNVYSKSGEMVLKVDFKEFEFSTIIRINKQMRVGDIFENIQKRRKIDIDKQNFLIYGKVIGDTESFIQLDLKMPLSMIQDQYLRIDRKEYEDRPNGSVEEKQQFLNNKTDKGLFLKWSHPDDGNHDDDDDEEEDDDDDSSDQDQNQDSYDTDKPKRGGQKLPPLTQYEQIMMAQYEEFEVTKVTYVCNVIKKQSKRIIGIDENTIYNKKVPNTIMNVRSILCFLFPGSASDTKQPQKKIDDIKDMYIIEGTNLFIQFLEKDYFKYWLLYNPDPNVSKRMFEKLSFLRKTLEVRLP